jgi:hypothetical protein
VGDRWRPKSSGGVPEAAGTQQGVATFDAWGQGEKNPITGLFESYDLPAHGVGPVGDGVSWLAILEQWTLLEYDFADILHIPDIAALLPDVSWQWFAHRVTGLISDRGLLARFFTPAETEAPGD